MLAEIPSDSVHCVVTSPPFYGLRDYGTGKWIGGDPDCNHLGAPKHNQAGFNARYKGKENTISDLDPFAGTATVGMVALEAGHHFIGIDLSAEYIAIAWRRLAPYLLQGKLF